MQYSLDWNHRKLRSLMDLRAAVMSRHYDIRRMDKISDLFESTKAERTRGDHVEYILGRTLLTPRDAIEYINKCLDMAVGHDKVSWNHVVEAELPYSKERLDALAEEWRNIYPGLIKLLKQFHGRAHRLTCEQFGAMLEGVVPKLFERENFEGKAWLGEIAENLLLANIEPESNGFSWYDKFGPLACFLYDTSFLGFGRSGDDFLTFRYINPNGLKDVLENCDDAEPSDVWFQVHAVFRRHLGGTHVSGGSPAVLE